MKLREVLKRLRAGEGLKAFDTETSGLDWRVNHITGYVLTFGPDPKDSFYIPVRHKGNANIGGHVGPDTATGWDGTLAPGEQELLDEILHPRHRYVGHHLSFDLKFLYRVAGEKAFAPQFEDTMVNAPLIDEHAGKFSLEACCARAGVQAKKSQLMYDHIHTMFPEVHADRHSMGHFWRLPGDDEIAVEYAEGDGTSTWQLREWQMEEMSRQDVEHYATDITDAGFNLDEAHHFFALPENAKLPTLRRVHAMECRLIRVLARMTCKGMRVDRAKAQKLYNDLTRRIDSMMKMMPPGASVRSPGDVQAYLEKNGVKGGWPMTPKTKKPSFTEDYLKTIKPGQEILEVRHIMHMRDSFIAPLLETHIHNGRVHANFNQMRGDEYGTITGRLSCDSPNLQQAHKRDAERGRMLRGLFLPDIGKVFGEVDYSQCEPRLLAYYSRCRVLLDGYRAVPSVDAHTAVGIAISSGKWDPSDPDAKGPINKPLRESGKRVNQTLVTGGGKGVIVHKYGVNPREVDKIWNDYFRAMPEIKTLQTKAGNRMRKRGYVMSILGRRSRLNDPNKSYIAVNRLLQCGNADLLKYTMVRIDDYLEQQGRPPIDMLLNIHDALLFQFDESARHHYNKCLEIMQDVHSEESWINIDVPMEIDAGEGNTWALATFGPEKK